MKIYRTSVVVLFFCGGLPVTATTEKPASLPASYRDFTIYATSEPDPRDPGRIEMTLQVLNRGERRLSTRVELEPNKELGCQGDTFYADLEPGTKTHWQVTFSPPQHLVKEVIKGTIFFGNTKARNLFISVRGPDPPDWRPNRNPDVDHADETLLISERARVVATYAPRVRVDWWRWHPSSTVAPRQRIKPVIILAADGKTDYAILRGLTPAGVADQGDFPVALADLVRCIKLISGGAELDVIKQREAGRRVIELRQREIPEGGHPDSYRLFTSATGDVVIEADHVDGLRNGIYGLLTDHLDCHWFMPGKLGEEIPRPRDKVAVIGQIDQVREPSFFCASGTIWRHDQWNIRNRNVSNRNRMGFGHAWASLLKGTPELYEKHPEWWARDREGAIRKFDKSNGASFTNFCTTHPRVLETVARNLNERLSDPDTILTSIDPNDYAPFCLCETCSAMDASYGVENPDGSYSTDRLIHFANEMHRRLDAENKDKFLAFYVYGFQIQIPAKARPGPGVAGMICYMDWSYDHTRPMNDPTAPSNRKFLRLVKGWGELLPQFGFYDYPTDYIHYSPYGQVMKLREDLPLIRELGVTFILIEGQPVLAPSALNLYICSRLQYDVTEDADVLMEEFFNRFHGPAAEPMRKYWLTAEYYTATLRPGPGAQDRITRIPRMWAELDGYLQEAQALVADLPLSERRFRDRVEFQRDGFELGRGKCRIRDTLFTPRRKLHPEALTPENRRLVEDYLSWIVEVRGRHADRGWPALLPVYYYSNLTGSLRGTLERFDAAGVKAGTEFRPPTGG